ncbi:MAG: MCE family protein [Planctomycetes bacterium]|nr:MCE family protein [Planctomycetota bacterium]
MKPVTRDFLVGITAIGGLAGLVAILMFFGELSFDRHYAFKVRLGNAAGLAQGSRVTMSGVNIGQVTEAAIMPPAQGGVLLSVKVKTSVQIPRKCSMGIDKGLIGDAALDFVQQPNLGPTEAADVIRPGEIFDGGNPQTMFDKLAKSVEEPLSKLTLTAEKINRLADVYTSVGERFNDAIEPRTVADVTAGKAPNVRSTLQRLDNTLASANAWLDDEQIKKQVRDAIAKADSVLTDAGEAVKTIRSAADKADSTMENVRNAAAKVEDKFGAISEQALTMLRKTEDAAAKLTDSLETATRGPGTMGQLMQNPDLYNSLRDAAQRLDRTLAELQIVVEKLKKEGIKIGL